MIGGKTQKCGKVFAAKDFTMDANGIKMDIAPAYGLEGENSVIREIAFDRASGTITVADAFKLAKAEGIIERFITKLEPKAVDGGAVIGNDKASMTLTITKGDAEVKLYSGTEKDHGGNPFTVWYVDFVAENAPAECEFAFEIK